MAATELWPWYAGWGELSARWLAGLLLLLLLLCLHSWCGMAQGAGLLCTGRARQPHGWWWNLEGLHRQRGLLRAPRRSHLLVLRSGRTDEHASVSGQGPERLHDCRSKLAGRPQRVVWQTVGALLLQHKLCGWAIRCVKDTERDHVVAGFAAPCASAR